MGKPTPTRPRSRVHRRPSTFSPGPLEPAIPSRPRIGVLLPVRDAEPTLDLALRSLWRQTFSRFEVLAVDDGSRDGSARILALHAARERRLRLVPRSGEGLVAALEAAREHTRAPFLARFDADDVCHPDRLRLQLAALERLPRVAALGSRVVLFPRNRVGPGWRRYERWLNGLTSPADHARELFVESPLAHPSVLLRADAVAAVGGYRECSWAEDYDLWLRLAAAGWELAKLNTPLLAWRQTEGRLSLRSPRYRVESFLDAKAHYLARHPLLAGRRVALWGAGKTGRRLARRLAAHGVEVIGFYEVDAARIGRSIGNAPVRSWQDLERPGRHPLLVAVGAAGARALIRPELERRGYVEGVDCLFAA